MSLMCTKISSYSFVAVGIFLWMFHVVSSCMRICTASIRLFYLIHLEAGFGYVYGVSCVSDMLTSVLKCIGSV